MVNQIALNLATQGEDAAIAATTDHINMFWDPRMKRLICEHGGAGLSPIAAAAIAGLTQTKMPPTNGD